MSRWLTLSLATLATLATVASLYFYRENRALHLELADAASRVHSVDTETARADAGVPPAAPPGVESAAAPAASTPSPSPAVTSAPGPAGPRERFDRRDRGTEYLASALTDPEARAAMLTGMKGSVDRRFGDYFVKLGLNPTQIEALRTLLAERQMIRMEAGLLERNAEDDLARTEAQAWRDAKLASTEADINAITGENGLQKMQDYQDSFPQRQVVDDIARRANYAGAPLSEAASERLLNVVRQAAADLPVSELGGRGGDGDGRGGPGPQRREPVTAEAVSKYIEDLRAQNQRVIEEARSFLTQPQLEALVDQQIDAVQQAEARLNFMVRNPDLRGGRGGGGGRGPRG